MRIFAKLHMELILKNVLESQMEVLKNAMIFIRLGILCLAVPHGRIHLLKNAKLASLTRRFMFFMNSDGVVSKSPRLKNPIQ